MILVAIRFSKVSWIGFLCILSPEIRAYQPHFGNSLSISASGARSESSAQRFLALFYQRNMELIASVSSALLLLSIQQMSIHA